MDDKRGSVAGRRKTDMAALTERMDAAEAWYAKHDKECATRYKKIEEQTAVLPEMKRQLDDQDQVISGIASGIKLGKKAWPVLVVIGGMWSSIQALMQYVVAHWH